MRCISDEEWPRFFGSSMQRVLQAEEPPLDFWPYVEAIPQRDFQGYDCSQGTVKDIYRHPDGRLEHVLVESNDPNVFMVIARNQATNLGMKYQAYLKMVLHQALLVQEKSS